MREKLEAEKEQLEKEFNNKIAAAKTDAEKEQLQDEKAIIMKYLDRKIETVDNEQAEKTSMRKEALKKSFENKKEALSVNRSGYVRYSDVEKLRQETGSESEDDLLSVDSNGNLRQRKSEMEDMGVNNRNNRMSPAKTQFNGFDMNASNAHSRINMTDPDGRTTHEIASQYLPTLDGE